MSELITAFAEWAWQRHHNIASWYIRPLFLMPLAWFAYRRIARGIVVTLLALATSMFWFPAPATPDPRVAEFLAFEQRWLTAGLTTASVLGALLVVAALTAYCVAFWRRSVAWGVVLLNAMAVGKLAWCVWGDDAGWAMAAPALTGLIVCDLILLAAVRYRKVRHVHP